LEILKRNKGTKRKKKWLKLPRGLLLRDERGREVNGEVEVEVGSEGQIARWTVVVSPPGSRRGEDKARERAGVGDFVLGSVG
jgi:hypothetical protein